ncbi:glycoside hydrolase family 2 TIM barrel-domain containing protein [Mucilaginibacter sp. UYCu711]|uniref:glycoside hydrolase family 2 TIM barrel-domain containing protein n=1 Tax=Mucilaginibacter sp. UYCu711 TaxID=3156339 RepID=UPI003D23B913
MKKYLLHKALIKLLSIVALLFMYQTCLAQQSTAFAFLNKTDTATVPKEIENPENIGINKELNHATLMPYGNLSEALKANRRASSLAISLNGLWKFNWVDWPQKRPSTFYKTNYDVSKWKDIKVPSSFQVQGYGTPDYSNFTLIFQSDFPRVMSEPKNKKYTTLTERNPVGSYRRDFDVPTNWNGRRIFLTFDGVDAGFFLWVNGKKVGYSVNSRNAAEFDLTKYVHPGKNMVAVEVYRFTSGSYLENQDMWRLSGIFRNVTLWSTPQEHIRDFFIKTNLDAKYRDADLTVSAKVKNYSNVAVPARQVELTLYNGLVKVPGAAVKKAVPALQPGEEVKVEASFHVTNPEKWTAETPKLYTSVITLNNGATTLETMSARTGFREIEIKGRLFLVNGVPIKLKGVNRHENWPDDGHAITEEQMIKDIVLIKQTNSNHVRTCHYSDDPRWYELCDEYGIYLVAEANVECHAQQNQFNEEPTIKAAIIERNVANVENFKNHPSVVIWSLGNENGRGGTNFRAALTAVRSIDDRPTHYEGFGIGNDRNPADIDSQMYTGVAGIEEHAKDDKLTKPYYLCEYAHAMFNSMGSVDLYNDMFDKHPELLGGAIWEWQDQGLYNNRQPNHPVIAYGGGFGDYPNDHYFIHKGVVFSNRTPKPHFPELKHAYQWITIKAKDLNKKTFTIKNRYQFTNLSSFNGKWEVSENGTTISSGNLAIGSVSPGHEKDIKLPYVINPNPGAEYFVRVSFQLSSDKLWAKHGFEIAEQQFELHTLVPAVVSKSQGGDLTLNDSKDVIKVKGADFSVTFDKTKGTFTKLEKSGDNMLRNEGGPMLHLWRAPHQKDDIWAYTDWVKNGLKEISWVAGDIKSTQLAPNVVQISANLTGTGQATFVVHHKVVYTINGKGEIKSENSVDFSDPKLILARIGVRLFLNKDLNQVDYLGRGPMENYSDRKSGFDVGHYSSSVYKQMTGYEKPMEQGNHEDVRWANLTGVNGLGLNVKQVDSVLQIGALPYSDEEMENVEYKIDLPKSSGTVLCISHKTLGVGSNGCGPRPLEPYQVFATPTTFSYQIELLKKK